MPGVAALGQRMLDQLLGGRPRPKPPSAPANTDPLGCENDWRRVLAETSLPGTPALDAERAEMLARSKGEPVVFVNAPSHPQTKSSAVRGYRKALRSARFPWDSVGRIDAHLKHTPRIARQVFLVDGYLYAERAELAWALWDRLRLEHLFDEPALVIERGAERLEVVRDKSGTYLYTSGPDRGKAARLLLFDRVSVAGEKSREPLHRDVRSLRHTLGFERMKIVRATDRHLLAELRYGKTWVRSVLSTKGPDVALKCEIVPTEEREQLARDRSRLAEEERMVSVFREAMLGQISDALPFDEPRTEWGQQDGHLRFHWKKAYETGEDHYFFNFDRYPVFSTKGEPLAPQVCIDFVTETLERATGTRFRARGNPPGREVGAVDFDQLLANDRRQVTRFIAWTQKNTEAFEAETLSSKRQTPYTFKQRFYANLARDADSYRPGTIVVIRGFAPWDFFSTPHYHAFFVYETDPVTGTPILLAGNAGKPRVQSWETVMARAPQRAIRYRLHPKSEWWSKKLRPEPGPTRAAPPLFAMF